MMISTRFFQFLSIALLAMPFGLQADSWSCRHNNDVREIHIVRATSEAVPCSVVYKKLTEGVEDQTLWTAENDANYCEDKAKAFVEKQVGWGWTCVETIADKMEEEAAPAEADTAAQDTASEAMTEVATEAEAAAPAAQ